MEQENDADKRHDEHLFDELVAKVMHGAQDQVGSVVDRHDPDIRRQPLLDGFDFFLHRSNTRSAFSPNRMTTIPPTTSPLPSSSATPRRISGPSALKPRHPKYRWCAAYRGLYWYVLYVLNRPYISQAADHEFRFCHFDYFSACFAVAVPDRCLHHCERYSVRLQFCRINGDLVLLDIPAHARNLAHPFDAGHRYLKYQSCRERSSASDRVGEVSAYSYTQPTPVASGPSVGTTPAGSLFCA